MKHHFRPVRMDLAARLALASILGILVGQAPIQAAEEYSATVRVTDRVLNTVNRQLFGDNIEWTNDGMGFWLPKEKKLDEKLVEEVRAAGVTHLRYPGGTLSDYFDWSKAVGDKRQPIPNPFAKGRLEDPRFGPAEFIALCRKLGIPGTITLNAGTGTPEDAAGWVKYCRDQGFPVTAFAVGNEIYMAKPPEPIVKTADQYIDFYLRCRAAIEKVAPGTRLGVIGLHDTGAFSLNQHKDWMEKVLRALGDKIAFIDLHNGYAPAARLVVGDPQAKACTDDEFVACFLAAPVYVQKNLEVTKADLAKYAIGGGKGIEIHVTEYGPLVYPVRPQNLSEDMAWNRSLTGALYQASLFNVFAREPKLTSANHLPLHQDGFGALVGVHNTLFFGSTHWRNIVFYVFQMYAKMAGREVLAAEVESPVYSSPAVGIVPKLASVPYLDVGAYRTSDGKKLTLFLINRDVRRIAAVKLDFGSAAWRAESITTLSADSYGSVHKFCNSNIAENAEKRPGCHRLRCCRIIGPSHIRQKTARRSPTKSCPLRRRAMSHFRSTCRSILWCVLISVSCSAVLEGETLGQIRETTKDWRVNTCRVYTSALDPHVLATWVKRLMATHGAMRCLDPTELVSGVKKIGW